MDLMFKRTIFGVALAPAFALGVALTAYAANGWHGDPAAMRDGAPTRCDTTPVVSVERSSATRLHELTVSRQAQIASRPVVVASCVGEAGRN
ncbi:MAG: hypothetical protein P8Z36_14690 [Gemmatimonadota bacterium]|jgi:hypothetical protein